MDLLLVNEAECRLLTAVSDLSNAVELLIEKGPKIVVVKRGSHGCYVATPEERFSVKAFDIHALDTTGAGDAFDAAFIAMVLEEKPLEEAARFSNAVGALVSTKFGAREGLPSREQVMDFLSEGAEKDNA